MNETLKFSWGHIIAFLALIALGYVSFVGYSYLTDGNFIYAGIGTSITLIAFFAMFIGIQSLKAAGNKIGGKIILERCIIFLSPLVFVAGMIGFAHFWTVKDNNDSIVENFKSSINNSQQLFDDYESYAEQRIARYDSTLNQIVAQKKGSPEDYKSMGFDRGYEKAQILNMVEILRLQLLSDNYLKIKEEALAWIQKANNGASTWNVFLIGNTHEIKEALNNWESELLEISSPVLTGEDIYEEVPDFKSNGALMASSGLDTMATSFKEWKFPVWQSFFFGVIIYFLLILPYLIQTRHGRQVAAGYSLFKTRKTRNTLEKSPFNKIILPKKESVKSLTAQEEPVIPEATSNDESNEECETIVTNNPDTSLPEENSREAKQNKIRQLKIRSLK